jgi:hypothetical protein
LLICMPFAVWFFLGLIPGGQEAPAGWLSSLLSLSIFEKCVVYHLATISPPAQNWFSTVLLFGVYAMPLIYISAPSAASLTKGLPYPLQNPNDYEFFISRWYKENPLATLMILAVGIQGYEIIMHFGLINCNSPPTVQIGVPTSFARTFLLTLVNDPMALPLAYLVTNSSLFILAMVLAGIADQLRKR